MSSPYYSLYVPNGTHKENLLNSQELLNIVIISFTLMALTFELGVILFGETGFLSLLGFKGLKYKAKESVIKKESFKLSKRELRGETSLQPEELVLVK